jgi:hypothetical protein
MTSNFQKQLIEHGITFSIIVLFAYVTFLIRSQWQVNYDLVGGAALLSYILFNLRMMTTVAVAIVVSILIFKQTEILALESIMSISICTIGPAIALYIMSSFKEFNISSIRSISLKQILLLSIVQAIFCSIFKLSKSITITGNVAHSDIANYFMHIFTVDVLGTLAIVYFAIKIIPLFGNSRPTQST